MPLLSRNSQLSFQLKFADIEIPKSLWVATELQISQFK